MTAQQIDRDRLRALAENATPGPWEAEGGDIWNDAHGFLLNPRLDDADADFIAAARTAVPALLDMLDQAEAERDWNLRSSRLVKEERIKANARAERAEARIKAVRELHTPAKLKEHTGTSWRTDPDDHLVCAHCTDPDGGGYATYPCETLQVLGGEG